MVSAVFLNAGLAPAMAIRVTEVTDTTKHSVPCREGPSICIRGLQFFFLIADNS